MTQKWNYTVSHIEEFLKKISEISENQVNEILTVGLNSSILKEMPGYISQLQRFASMLSKVNLGILQNIQLMELGEKLNTVLDDISNIRDFFSPSSDSIDEINNKVRLLFSEFVISYQTLITDTTYLLTPVFNNNNNDEDIRNSLQENIKAAEEAAIAANKDRDKVRAILESAQALSADIGVVKHAAIFEIEATNHNKLSNKWLWAVGVIIFLILLFAILVLCNVLELNTENSYNIVQHSLGKVIFLSALYFALTFANKNYKIHKHNFTINQHKANSLKTFETFVNGTSDQQTKNAILLSATESIFSNQNTGYSNQDSENNDPTKIIELIKSPSNN